jgi:hypothetical protein
VEQQLVLEFPVPSIDDYDAVAAFEEELAEVLGEEAEVEGHEARRGRMYVFVWCHDAEETFAAVRPVVDEALLPEVRAGWRHADTDAFEPLWPPGLDAFDVAL